MGPVQRVFPCSFFLFSKKRMKTRETRGKRHCIRSSMSNLYFKKVEIKSDTFVVGAIHQHIVDACILNFVFLGLKFHMFCCF